jgi:holo-[acyl-carrier protein] synthase
MINQKQIGIGIDITEIQKFKKIPYDHHKSFYKKIFTASEINYCLKFKDPYAHFAGKFAIKEAVIKSIPDRISMIDIETYHVKSKPHVRLKLENKYSFYVSISHENNFAVAVVISQLE